MGYSEKKSFEAGVPYNGCSSSFDHISTLPFPLELQYACKTMNGICLRRYLIRHLLRNEKLLREELPLAIFNSPKPSKLVLDCVGKFFKQTTRSFENNPHLLRMRQLSVIVLESMLLAVSRGSIQVPLCDQKTADESAFFWKKRMMIEGGIQAASEDDASGLLFLICAFGIPKHFTGDDVWNLVIVSLNRHSASLNQSLSLATKLAGILKKKLKSGMTIEALDIVRAFKMEDEFPLQKILNAYMETQNEILYRRINKEYPTSQKWAMSKHISVLKSTLSFIEEKKYDALKETLQKLVAKLEHENDDINHKKRKSTEISEGKPKMRKRDELTLKEGFCSYDDTPFPDFATRLESFVGLPAEISDGPPPDIYAFVDKVVEMEFGSNYMQR